MGVLTKLYIAALEDAQDIADSGDAPSKYPWADLQGIHPDHLNHLHRILTGETLEDLLGLYDPVAERDEMGPWVSLVPAVMVERLGSLDGVELAEAARNWAATEEMRGWPAPAVQKYLESIAAMARRARAEDKRLFVWISL